MALASVEYRCSHLRWCYLQQKVHFFQSHPYAVIPNKLAFPSHHCSISNYTLKIWSYKPSHKHDSNKHQSNALIGICNHKSDETRSVTHVNKAYLGSWGLWASVSFIPLPLPLPHHSFFLLSSLQLSRRTRKEMLATQATTILIVRSLKVKIVTELTKAPNFAQR